MLSFVTSPPGQPATSPAPGNRKPSWATDDVGPDPFGQAGVRQYIGKWLAWLCVLAAIITSAMWYRSSFFFDTFEWRGKGQTMRIISAQSQLLIDYSVDDQKRLGLGGSGWSYRGGYTMHRNLRDNWQESPLKTLGFEFQSEPLKRSAASGFWLRAKWQFIVIVMILVPTARGIYLIWCRRREAHQ